MVDYLLLSWKYIPVESTCFLPVTHHDNVNHYHLDLNRVLFHRSRSLESLLFLGIPFVLLKLGHYFLDGIVDGSSDEDGSDEEVLDLSASEDEKDLLELYESEEEHTLDSNAESPAPPSGPECDYVEKPLPPIPTVAEKEFLEPAQKFESHVDKESKPDDDREVSRKFSEKSEDKSTTNNDVEKENQSLPLFTSEDEIKGSGVPQKKETFSETIANPSQSRPLNEDSSKGSDTCQPVESQVNSVDSGDRANEAESHVKYENEDDKAR